VSLAPISILAVRVKGGGGKKKKGKEKGDAPNRPGILDRGPEKKKKKKKDLIYDLPFPPFYRRTKGAPEKRVEKKVKKEKRGRKKATHSDQHLLTSPSSPRRKGKKKKESEAAVSQTLSKIPQLTNLEGEKEKKGESRELWLRDLSPTNLLASEREKVGRPSG